MRLRRRAHSTHNGTLRDGRVYTRLGAGVYDYDYVYDYVDVVVDVDVDVDVDVVVDVDIGDRRYNYAYD